MQDSQSYLSPPAVSASVANPLRVIGVLRAFGKLKKLPKGQQLSDLVPSALYEEFAVLAKQFRLAKRHKVPILTHTRRIDIKRALEILDSPTLDSELACLQTTVVAASTDLEQAKLRAQAWADGDAALLQALDYPDVMGSCVLSLYSGTTAMALRAEAEQAWLASAEQVRADHQVSFASLPMREIVLKDGLLHQLEKRGYQVRGQ